MQGIARRAYRPSGTVAPRKAWHKMLQMLLQEHARDDVLKQGMLITGVAYLEPRVGLQNAMLVVPACYLLSGLGFLFAERIAIHDDQVSQPP